MRKTKKDWDEYYQDLAALKKNWLITQCPHCGSVHFCYQEQPDYRHKTYKEVKTCLQSNCLSIVETRTTTKPYNPQRQLIYTEDMMTDTLNDN